MPRANRYFIPGKFYHLTHRCHDRQFLFKFAKDRDDYRKAVWESLRRFAVQVLSYCITSNHTHFLVRSETSEIISPWMQQIEGRMAQAYNRRKRRSGAFWEGRYHCTMIEPGPHLWRCMVYIELNMVRAGVVPHPEQWPWCSYQEWMGKRRRYTVVDQGAGLRAFGQSDLTVFRENYRRSVEKVIEEDGCRREPAWTESIAVGSDQFIARIKEVTQWRQRLETRLLDDGGWALREQPDEIRLP